MKYVLVSNLNLLKGNCNLSVSMCRHLGVDVYGKGSCSDPGLTCDRKSDDKCLQMLNTTYKVTPDSVSSLLIPHDHDASVLSGV